MGASTHSRPRASAISVQRWRGLDVATFADHGKGGAQAAPAAPFQRGPGRPAQLGPALKIRNVARSARGGKSMQESPRATTRWQEQPVGCRAGVAVSPPGHQMGGQCGAGTGEDPGTPPSPGTGPAGRGSRALAKEQAERAGQLCPNFTGGPKFTTGGGAGRPGRASRDTLPRRTVFFIVWHRKGKEVGSGAAVRLAAGAQDPARWRGGVQSKGASY